jgi:hypothetical protein
MIVQLMGKRWHLRFVPRLRADGQCDPPYMPFKEILIATRLSGKRELEVLLHEMLHACNWQFDEEHISQMASDIADVLWRLKYRRVE